MTHFLKISTTLVLFCFVPVTGFGQVEKHVDIDYKPDSEHAEGRDLLDVYAPAGASNAPVIVYFHGGALMKGDRSENVAIGTRIANLGVVFVGPTYRVSPEVSHPQHALDAAAAVKWVLENIEAYGGDPENVYIAGHSAGAYLAALLAYDGQYLNTAGVSESPLRGAILMSPFLYVEETAPVRIQWGVGAETIWGSEPDRWREASASQLVAPSQMESLLIYADGDADWRKDQIVRFQEAMIKAGDNQISLIEIRNRTHGTLSSEALAEDDIVGSTFVDFIYSNQ